MPLPLADGDEVVEAFKNLRVVGGFIVKSAAIVGSCQLWRLMERARPVSSRNLASFSVPKKLWI